MRSTDLKNLLKKTAVRKRNAGLIEQVDDSDKEFKITIPIRAMGKPRMTRADAWVSKEDYFTKGRPEVIRYRRFKRELQEYLSCMPENRTPYQVDFSAYFPFPESYSLKKRAALAGTIYTIMPDRDNIDKAILDSFLERDQGVAIGRLEKYWDDGGGQRIELIIKYGKAPRKELVGKFAKGDFR